MHTKLPRGAACLLTFAAISMLFLLSPTKAKGDDLQTSTRDLKLVDSGSIAEWPTSTKRFALVIGVDEYMDTQINRLEGAGNDAKVLANALTEHAGFPKDQVILLTSDQPQERRPSLGNILRRLSNLRSLVPRDGLLLFAFAGHGMEREGRAYLLPSDAQVSEDLGLLERTAINVIDIRDWIRKTGVGQVVIILDACRSDPTSGRSGGDNLLTEAYTSGLNFEQRNHEITAFATLYATAVGHRAYEYKEKKQGYFTWALVEGIKGAAANVRGEITLAALVEYVQEQVPRRIILDLGSGKVQQPFAEIWGYKANDLIVAAVARTPGNTSSSPPLLDPVRIELTFWDTIKNSTDPADFKAYLDKYPNGEFVALARRRAQPRPEPVGESTNANQPNTHNSSPSLTSGGGNNPFNPTGKPLKTVNVDVLGKRDWTSSGLIVRRGDRLRITASGTVVLDPTSGRATGPDGIIDLPDGRKLMPDHPTGALIAVIGADNDDFILIGLTSEFTAGRDGLLFLSVNEGNLSDNTGTYRAVIELQQRPK